MDNVAEKILTQALQTPLNDRAIIAERIISSLDTITDLDVEIAWQEEIHRRVAEVDNRAIECISWEMVREQLRRNAVVTG